MKAIWPDVKKDATFLRHFPSVYPKGKGPPRDYFFNILNTLQNEYLQKILAHANEKRMGATGDIAKRQGIKISEFWEEQLKTMPYVSSKCPISVMIFWKFDTPKSKSSINVETVPQLGNSSLVVQPSQSPNLYLFGRSTLLIRALVFSILIPSFYLIEKSGKTLHLLKQSSKPIKPREKRKKIEVMGTLAQFKESK